MVAILALLASLNRRSENIVVEPIVVPELELSNVQRQIFAANFVIAAHNSAFENTPKASMVCV
jgi:hypothetical protein